MPPAEGHAFLPWTLYEINHLISVSATAPGSPILGLPYSVGKHVLSTHRHIPLLPVALGLLTSFFPPGTIPTKDMGSCESPLPVFIPVEPTARAAPRLSASNTKGI